MAEGESADKQTGVQHDQPTLEAIIKGVFQRILKASTSHAAEGEANELRTRISRTNSGTSIIPFSTVLRCDKKSYGSGVQFNSLTTVVYILEVFIGLWIPSIVCIFNSAWS